jgi:hypothetical protein
MGSYVYSPAPLKRAKNRLIKAPVSGMEVKKKGKLLISHRYNCLPLLSSDPGGVQQELVV